MLLEKDRIAALSSLANDPELSLMAETARGIPTVRPDAESVLRIHPDVVLVGELTTQTTSQMLEQLGVRVIRISIPGQFEDIRQQTLSLSRELGVPERGIKLVADMDTRLSVLRQKVARRNYRPTALVFGENGYTQADNPLMDAILLEAGFTNAAKSIRQSRLSLVSLETLVLTPPQFLIRSPYQEKHPTLSSLMVTHPIFRHQKPPIPQLIIPLPLLMSGTPETVHASEILFEKTGEFLQASTP